MKIFLHEISDLATELDFTEAQAWVGQAVGRVDEKIDLPSLGTPTASLTSTPIRSADTSSKSSAMEATRPIQVHFSINKVDEVVVVSGHAESSVRLICSRCADYFDLPLSPSFSALFCKDPVMAGVAHLEDSNGRSTYGKRGTPGDDDRRTKPAGQNYGHARHAHDEGRDGDETSFGRDLDITYIAADYVDLGDVLTEQFQLLVPFQPVCQSECKGLCTTCGTNLNLGRCACSKIIKSTPFSILKEIGLTASPLAGSLKSPAKSGGPRH